MSDQHSKQISSMSTLIERCFDPNFIISASFIAFKSNVYVCIQRHPEGVASIGFKEAESAEACVRAMNGRWYGGRRLEVVVWDGVTNYQVQAI